MTPWLNHILFGVYPYVALSVLLIGSVVRFDHGQYTWRTGSSQLLRHRRFTWASNLFHIGILIILGGHIVGLLTPLIVFDTLRISHEFKQIMAMTVGGIAGIFAWIGLAMLVYRRLTDPRIRKTSGRFDIAVLIIIWAQLTLGLLTIPVSAGHLDGSEMMKFMKWAQGIVTLQPDADVLVDNVSWVFRCHMLLGMTILVIAPFTRLVHVWSAPIWYLGRTGYQIVRTKRPPVAGAKSLAER